MDEEDNCDHDPPSVSVVLGWGVAIVTFSLPRGPRPSEELLGVHDDDNGDDDIMPSNSWWRVTST